MKFFPLLVLLSASASAQPFAPVHPDASVEARALLAYLYDIDDDYTLAGQHNYNGNPNQYFERVHELTGKYPAVWGTDFIWPASFLPVVWLLRPPNPSVIKN